MEESDHGTDEQGGREDRWNEDLAGVISVWKDPEDGCTYVVNGHYRLALAKAAGVSGISVNYINAPNSHCARAVGALQNIAEGCGTVMDAARFFHDSGYTRAKLEEHGFPVGEDIAAQGLALADDSALFAHREPEHCLPKLSDEEIDQTLREFNHLLMREAEYLERKDESRRKADSTIPSSNQTLAEAREQNLQAELEGLRKAAKEVTAYN